MQGVETNTYLTTRGQGKALNIPRDGRKSGTCIIEYAGLEESKCTSLSREESPTEIPSRAVPLFKKRRALGH
jgi:hypothetical protein